MPNITLEEKRLIEEMLFYLDSVKSAEGLVEDQRQKLNAALQQWKALRKQSDNKSE